ncbi:hypothetical protein MRB53_021625 [Persea americana]|uniref:Uncharacterized protein n=1 Tax=Persea americana TaxID=3435 RepID=A0ACC2L5K1_PERAE|nr:hypothetical protein MRB53_021625 [Persea americana]
MSYLVYSLGEGIIGQLAFTGKHRWIFADAPASISWSSTDHVDGWQTLFSVGIKHFVLEENMLEVDCPCVTPEVVLKASGHVDKFADLMVKDGKTGTCYQANHLLKDFCKEKLEKDLSLTAEKAAELKHALAIFG